MVTPDQYSGLEVASRLVEGGVPVFLLEPALLAGEWDPDGGKSGCGYWIPKGWQQTEPDPAFIEKWAGHAVAAVMGHALDLVDVDPRNGGQLDDVKAYLPKVFSHAETPSGGWHCFVPTLGVRSRDNVLPGIDVKAGDRNGEGRGFAWIAPTLRRPKGGGEPKMYRWLREPHLDRCDEFDPSPLRSLVQAAGQGGSQASGGGTTTPAQSPWDALPDRIEPGGRHHVVHSLASALRGRGGWRVDDAVAYMRKEVWPRIVKGGGKDGASYTVAEFERDIRDVFERYPDGPGGLVLDRTKREPQVASDRALEPSPLIRLDRFLAQPDSEVIYRIEDIWPANGRVLFAAQYKAGKSTTLGNVARSMVDLEPFLGRFEVTPPPGQVLLIDDELHPDTLRRWYREQGITNADRIVVLTLRGQLSTFNIMDDVTRDLWARRLADAGVSVVIFDCLRPLVDALGLSEDKDIGKVLGAFDELLTASGATEGLVVHHMGHKGERSRGDSRLRDWPDAEWQLVRENDQPNSTRYFTAYGRDVDVPEMRLELSGRRLAVVGGSRRETMTEDALAELLDLLTSNPAQSGRKIEELMAHYDYSRGVIRAATKLGIREGSIITQKGAKNSLLHSRAPEAESAPVRGSSP